MASADLVDPESEIREDFVPLRGWQAVPLKDLLQVVEPLVGHIVPEIREFALDSLEFATSFLRRHGGVDPNGLSLQQIAALNLYTKENLGQPGLSFHSVLNRALHSRDRRAVQAVARPQAAARGGRGKFRNRVLLPLVGFQ
jgi:hypothetical protein